MAQTALMPQRHRGQEQGCLSERLGAGAVFEDTVVGLVEAAVQAAAAAEGASSANWLRTWQCLCWALICSQRRSGAMASQSSVQAGTTGKAAEAAVGLVSLEGPDWGDVLSAYRQLRQVRGCLCWEPYG